MTKIFFIISSHRALPKEQEDVEKVDPRDKRLAGEVEKRIGN